VDKKSKKRADRKCAFCDVSQYALLDLHRIIPGGKYTRANTVTCCSLHHRMIHAEFITIKEKRFSTAGYVLICEVDGKEQLFLC
jgi:hypothetical protein